MIFNCDFSYSTLLFFVGTKTKSLECLLSFVFVYVNDAAPSLYM